MSALCRAFDPAIHDRGGASFVLQRDGGDEPVFAHLDPDLGLRRRLCLFQQS